MDIQFKLYFKNPLPQTLKSQWSTETLNNEVTSITIKQDEFSKMAFLNMKMKMVICWFKVLRPWQRFNHNPMVSLRLSKHQFLSKTRFLTKMAYDHKWMNSWKVIFLNFQLQTKDNIPIIMFISNGVFWKFVQQHLAQITHEARKITY